MTFEQYLAILLKRWHIILGCFLVVGFGTFIGCKIIKPLYQSSTLVQVVIHSGSNNQSDYTALEASNELVQTEADLATSDSVIREVASHYPGITVNQLAGEVSSSIKLSTQLFEIDVLDHSPTQAARLANDIALTLTKQQIQTKQQDNAQAKQQIQQNLDQTSQQINDITSKIALLKAKGGDQGQIVLLQTPLSGLNQRYSQLQTALVQLELIQAQSGDFLQVVQTAQPATSPVRPNIPLYTGVGLIAGLLFGVLLALLYERLDTRVRTPEELVQLLAWPVLAMVWRTKSSSMKDLINPVGSNINSESYRILRTNIGFSSIDKPLRSLVVTSALSKDGKSLIAANLAIFMARAGKKTLLIDADLHRPTQHTIFGLLPEKLGLSNAVMAFSMPNLPSTPPTSHYRQIFSNTSALQQDERVRTDFSLESFVHWVGIPNLWVMPSGPLPPNPSEFLESKVMQRFLTVIANCGIEVVIFDGPPLLGLSDANILASKVDGALVVVDTTRATRDKLRQVKAALSQTGVNVLGCVANKLQHKRKDSTDYYYYTTDQNTGEKATENRHRPSIPGIPILAESPFEQRTSCN